MNEKYRICTSEKMKRDLSELCDKCPLKDELIELIKDNLNNAKEKKEILSAKLFEEYAENEMRICSELMSKTISAEFESPDDYVHRWKRTKNHILRKEWIKGLKELLEGKGEESVKITNSSRPNRTDIAYYCYYASETKTLNTENTFPSDKAWLEIGKRFNKNHKNIQQVYNSILNDKTERLKKTKEKNIKFVINNMLNDNEKAKKLAKDELKLLEFKS